MHKISVHRFFWLAHSAKMCDINHIPQAYADWLFLSDKGHRVKWLFEINDFLAVCGANLGSEFTTNSLRHKSFWTCLSTAFSLPSNICKSLIFTVLRNQCEFRQAKFCSYFSHEATIFLHFKFSFTVMEKEGQELEKLRSLLGLSTSCGLLGWLSQRLISSGQNVLLTQNSQKKKMLLPVPWCPFDHGR